MCAVDDERDDSAHCRVEKPVAEPGKPCEDDERAETEMAGCVENGERADRDKTPDVGQDHHPAALVAVGERTADQEGREQARALNCRTSPILPAPAIVKVFQPSAVRKAASPTSETA
jgi:hypothetical protein